MMYLAVGATAVVGLVYGAYRYLYVQLRTLRKPLTLNQKERTTRYQDWKSCSEQVSVANVKIRIK